MVPKINSEEFQTYNPYQISKSEFETEIAAKMLIDSFEKKGVIKYLFSNTNSLFFIDSMNSLYSSFWKKYYEIKQTELLKQMIKHAVIHKKNCKYYLMDIIVLFWYLAYIPTREKIKGLENPFRLNTVKTMGKSLMKAVSDLGLRSYLDEFVSQDTFEYNQVSSYVIKRTSLSIYVFLYHLSAYDVLEHSADYYLNWLANSNYKWLNLPKEVDFETMHDSSYYIIPNEIPVIGGQKLGCIYKYFEQYKDYYMNTYSECDLQPIVDSILRHQARKELIPTFRE